MRCRSCVYFYVQVLTYITLRFGLGLFYCQAKAAERRKGIKKSIQLKCVGLFVWSIELDAYNTTRIVGIFLSLKKGLL